MQRDSVHKGLFVKLMTDYSNVPARTWATVNTTGTSRDGTWWFTVRWRPYTPIPHKFPRGMAEYSTNLWERDLALFEVVSSVEEEVARANREVQPLWNPASLPQLHGGRRAARPVLVHPNQLSLFVSDDL